MRGDWERAERAYSARVDALRQAVALQAELRQPYEQLVRECGVAMLVAAQEVALAYKMDFDTVLALRELRIRAGD